jgi:dGTPase
LQGWGSEGGLQLSLAVLGAFSKYPRTSDFAVKDKFGVMEAHKEQASFVFEALGLKKLKENSETGGFEYSRHPIAYIVEAADDIAYVTADLEDAVRGGVIEFGVAEKLLKSIGGRSEYSKGQTDKMKRYGGIGLESNNAKLRYLRTHAVTEMVREAEKVFLEKYDQIMKGEYQKIVGKELSDVRQYGELLKDSKLSDKVDDIKTISSAEIHNARGKIENEVAGKNIIFGLLDMFGAVFSKLAHEKSLKNLAEIDRKLALIFPWDNYFHSKELDDAIGQLKNEDMLYMLVDFVSGMTDRYASSMFRQLSGNQQPFANW